MKCRIATTSVWAAVFCLGSLLLPNAALWAQEEATEAGAATSASQRRRAIVAAMLARKQAAEADQVNLSPAAVETQARLEARSGPAGEKATIDLEMTAPIMAVLEHISAEAAKPPRNIKILVDYQGVRSAMDSTQGPMGPPGVGPRPPRAAPEKAKPADEEAIALSAKDVTIRQALDLALPAPLGYAVLDDGAVIVSERSWLHYYTERWPVPEGEPAGPAARTRRLLRQEGVIDGRNWSLDLAADGQKLGDVLDDLAAQAALRGVKILIDRTGLRQAGCPLDEPVTIKAKGVSLEQGLMLTLLGVGTGSPMPESRLAYLILADGTVLVVARPGSLDRIWPPDKGEWSEAAESTYDKLRRKGVIDGQDWSVTVSAAESPLEKVLDSVAEKAAAKPWDIKILVDRKGLTEGGVELDKPVTVSANDVSLEQALMLAAGQWIVCIVRTDGSVMITGRLLRSLPGQFFGDRRPEPKFPQGFPRFVMQGARSLEVAWPPEAMNLNRSNLNGWLLHDNVAGRAIADVLGVPVTDWTRFTGNPVSAFCDTRGDPRSKGEASSLISFPVHLRASIDPRGQLLELRPVADELAEALVARLREALVKEHETKVAEWKEQRDSLGKKLEEAKKKVSEYDSLAETIRAFRADLRIQEPELAQKVTQMELRVQDVRMDLAGKKSRVEVLEKKIAEISAKVSDQVKGDPVVAQLEKVIQLRDEQLQRLKALVESGRATTEEVAQKEIELAEDRARLVERQEAVRRDAGGEMLTRLNTELTLVSVDAAEAEARLKMLNDELKEPTGLLTHVRRMQFELERREKDVPALRSEVEKLTGDLKSYEAMLQRTQAPPEVTVLDR